VAREQAVSAPGEHGEIVNDVNQSLVRLLPKLAPADLESAEKLARAYIAKYARPASPTLK